MQLDLLPMESVPTSSAEDSLVPTFQSPAKAPVLLANAADYGENSPELLASFDRDTSSWRTSQRCLVEGMARFLETWPRSGLMRNGTAYLLQPLARLTAETGSGLLPTATAGDAKASGSRNTESSKAHAGTTLTDWSRGDGGRGRMLPTPTANQYSHADLDALLARRERVKAKGYNGNGFGLTLEQSLMLGSLPTPRASEWKGTGPLGSKSHSHRVSRGYLDATMQEVSGATGRLNPRFVEWMMGFPAGFTEFDVSEMPSSRKSSKRSE